MCTKESVNWPDFKKDGAHFYVKPMASFWGKDKIWPVWSWPINVCAFLTDFSSFVEKYSPCAHFIAAHDHINWHTPIHIRYWWLQNWLGRRKGLASHPWPLLYHSSPVDVPRILQPFSWSEYTNLLTSIRAWSLNHKILGVIFLKSVGTRNNPWGKMMKEH